ncbi:tRNA(fMet)-specific endonuclease VapC (plasmid) [Piscirickettsia salmonis]|uniref:Ribonuclease VapC n=1 Tax=Piscirickettsia salmonis TaxID=1238 RepID=A0A1L6TI66_PISSA|nr:type II toxin-antitoxin system VapC family toxin [Piscirickettsia salmonis]AKP74910.1 twitching motility protein PilT [Piscirickettsia salmonis LF-89 = ATCC VR-1361]ALB24677.1 VapC [Piscirickettsia salmonis]ALY04540.1 twitching motility protein PilT [Piscirickettsia salmonis]AMA43911.1 twitching motility protein PilT [Piscirickettsia salmonis]AOS37129.1 twitching motility protein PilT [Piscirickettsia salmonis]
MLYMLDTNICIYLIKQKPRSYYERLMEVEKSRHILAISSIVLSELQFGVARSQHQRKNQEAINTLVNKLDVLPYEEKAAKYYGDLRADLQKKGTVIGGNDMIIAAHALSEKAVLVTHNTKEFQRVDHLELEDWAS